MKKTNEDDDETSTLIDKRLKKDDENISPTVNVWQLFRFADKIDCLLLSVGGCFCLITTICSIMFFILYGIIGGIFANDQTNTCNLYSNAHCPFGIELNEYNFDKMNKYCNLSMEHNNSTNTIRQRLMPNIYLLIVFSGIELFSFSLQYILFEISCKRQVNRIRILLFESLIKRDVTYFDSITTTSLNSSIFENVEKIRGAIGWELSIIVTDIGIIIGIILTSFIINWRLSFLTFLLIPLIILSSIVFAKETARATVNEFQSYSKANNVAEEVFGSLRTVISLNGIQFEKNRYENHLNETIKTGRRKGLAYGIYNGIIQFILHCVYPISLYYGSILMNETNSTMTITTLLIFIMCLVESLLFISSIGPFVQLLAEATGAARSIWQLIDESIEDEEIKKRSIIIKSKKDKPIISRGEVVFNNVSFSYPTRPTVQVLHNLSFVVEAGKTIALVGASGSGKSTCVQLLLAFYDLSSGKIEIDGHSISDFNIEQLRQSIGVVSQEPILFATSIYENIRLGNENATQSDIEEAAQQANAHQFIERLPQKYETLVGERGVHLSGGEKQRIALARALISKPSLLILDEATSALDYENEIIVQEALDRACQNRTTIIIAHRLSTIEKADSIYVFRDGIIVENGNHQSLMTLNGVYAELVQFQQNKFHSSVENHQEKENRNVINDYDQYHDEQIQISNDEFFEKEKDKEREDEEDNLHPLISFFEIMRLNRPEWMFIVAGIISCLGCGLATPIVAILYGYTIKILATCHNRSQQERLYIMYFLFFILAIIIFFLRLGQAYFFSYSGSSLSHRLRSKAFFTMLSQEIAWHDRPENHSGALCVRLSSDAEAVQKMTGIRISLLFEAIGSFGIGFIIGIIFCWQLALIVAGYIAFLCILSLIHIKWNSGLYLRHGHLIEEASSITIEVFQNIRTVKQLTQEKRFVKKYKEVINQTFITTRIYLCVSGIIAALTVVTLPLILCVLYLEAIDLVEQGILKSSNLIFAFTISTFCLHMVEMVFIMQEEWEQSASAANDFLKLFRRKPLIDNGDITKGIIIKNFKGNIHLKDIHFRYPLRRNHVVLNEFQLKIQSGQRIALVGPSGCGKSTIIQLLQRFYDVDKGQILFDGYDIRSLNLKWMRSQLGLVNQEPILFNMTIRENITYGLTTFTEEQMIQSAQKANIHQLIETLPDGYNTHVGLRGVQLSGGEKQRIAIARILIRQPKILLFDEATSALDSYNEQIVQHALDQVTSIDDLNKCTTITIAHRLSTIESSDLIVVFNEQGQIIESPARHEQLMAHRGPYFRMQRNHITQQNQ